MLTLAVITLNEVDRLEACLSSVPFADEILVVDSGSSDGTVELARSLGARVVQTDWPGHVAQKNRALDLATGDWVLSLDADERLSPEAAEAVASVLEAPGGIEAVGLRRCSEWQGRYIRHGRWYPDRKVRLIRRGAGRWAGDDPHDRLVVQGRVRWLKHDILHVPYRSFQEHRSTMDRYSAASARSLASRGIRARWFDLLLRPPLHFVDSLLLRAGFLDGWRGVALAVLGARYVWLKWSRLRRLAP